MSDSRSQKSESGSAMSLEKTYAPGQRALFRIDWSPDGQLLSIPSDDGTITLWDYETGSVVKRFGTKGPYVTNVAWSPDNRRLAYASSEMWIYDHASGATERIFTGHTHSIWALSWLGKRDFIASGSYDRTVCVCKVGERQPKSVMKAHSGEVTTLAWCEKKQLMASGSTDQSVTVWPALESTHDIRRLKGHYAGVTHVAWSPDGKVLASASEDRTVILWDPDSGRRIHTLEGHTHGLLGIAFSPDGSVLASTGRDGGTLVWKCSTWEKLAWLPHGKSHPENLWKGIKFHPRMQLLAVADEHDTVIRIWKLDVPKLILNSSRDQTALYRNAKVVLVGDTGVGKSGLGMVLMGQPWTPTESTHSRRVWTFSNNEVERKDGLRETREVLLWDLAGQPDYRLIHQLHLTEVALALVVFDSRNPIDPFSGVRHWDRALRQAQRTQGMTYPVKKFLIAAREDVGRVGVSQERLETLSRELKLDGYFRTSAKEGWGISDLTAAIQSAFHWEGLPAGSSTAAFQKIKGFLLKEKQEGRVLSSVDDLFHAYVGQDQTFVSSTANPRGEFETCIGLVESRDLIQRLNFGNLVLLQPELLDSYASAIVNAAKDEPDGLGTLLEHNVRAAKFLMAEGERISDKQQEQLLLIATIEELVRHEIALRDSPHLVFPSQFTRENPDLPTAEERTVVFRFEGPIQNVYATLAVRLSHSEFFKRDSMFKNAVLYKAKVGGLCGLHLTEVEDGCGELTLFFDSAASEQTRFQFEDYTRTHLLRWALPETVQVRRIYRCTNEKCKEEITERQAHKRRELGFSTIKCNVCETEISLIAWESRISSPPASVVSAMDMAADNKRDLNAAAVRLKGKIAVGDFDVFLCHNSVDKPEVRRIAQRLKDHGILPWFDEWELRPGFPWQVELEKQIKRIKSAAVFVGRRGIGPWENVELRAFLQQFITRGCPVIPVLLFDKAARKSGGYADMPELPPFLSAMTWVDFRRKKPNPFERLIWGITGESAAAQ